MKIFLLGFAAGVLLPFEAGYVFVVSGRMPVATAEPPLPLEKYLARKALHAAMDPAIADPSRVENNEHNRLAGARVYHAQCAVCHSAFGQTETAISRGMFPHPPQLLPPEKGVVGDLVGETNWKVKNGIRLTGMPGFGATLSETEMWQVSLLLLHAKQLPESVREFLHQPD